MKRFSFIFVLFALVACSFSAHAEVIELKSGKIIDGKIIERTDDGIKVDTGEQIYNIRYKHIAKMPTMAEVVDPPEATSEVAQGAIEVSQAPTTEESLLGVRTTPLLTDRIEREAFETEVNELLYSNQFEKLDKTAHQLLESKELFSSGEWKLYHFYVGLQHHIKSKSTVKERQEYIDKLLEWGKAIPSSQAQQVALMAAYKDIAWDYRGSGYGDTVTKEGYRGFYDSLENAWNLGEQLIAGGVQDPHTYGTMITVGLGLGKPAHKLYEFIQASVRLEPTYYGSYRRYAMSLLPRWGGAPNGVEEFADWAVQKTKDKLDEGMYAIIAGYVYSYVGDDSYAKFNFDYARIKRGYLDLKKRYPNAFTKLNQFAWFASFYDDRQTARLLFEEIGDLWDEYAEDVWDDKATFLKWRKWALEGSENPGQRVIHMAAVKGDYEAVVKAIKEGSDINVRDMDGRTPLQLAIVNRNSRIAYYLINANADVDTRTEDGLNTIHLASKYGMPSVINMLINKGIDPDKRAGKWQWAAVHYAARNGYWDVVEVLQEWEPSVMNSATTYGTTPLHLAARNGQTEMVAYLLEQEGIVVDPLNKRNETPLHKAAEKGHLDAVKLLLGLSSALNEKSKRGATPLTLAVANEHTKVIEFLREAGAEESLKYVSDDDYNQSREYANQGQTAFQAKNYEEARAFFEMAIESNPYSAYALTNMSSLAVYIDRDFNKGLELAKQAIAADPDYAFGYYIAGRAAHELNQKDVYMEYFRVYVQMEPETYETQDLLKRYPSLKQQ